MVLFQTERIVFQSLFFRGHSSVFGGVMFFFKTHIAFLEKMDPEWRCISYWQWRYYVAMLVFGGSRSSNPISPSRSWCLHCERSEDFGGSELGKSWIWEVRWSHGPAKLWGSKKIRYILVKKIPRPKTRLKGKSPKISGKSRLVKYEL